jgi:prepilin-type N-terminal cleavage/methylation domain-containing protein
MTDRTEKHVLKSGFTIIEVLMAVTVLSIGIIGAVNVINYNISVTSNSVNRIVATNLAQDGIEMVRNIRDTNWLQGKFDVSGANAWDTGIDGVGNRRYIRFFCGDGTADNITSTPSGSTEKEKIDDCGAACQVYAYSSGNVKCYGDNYGGGPINGYTGAPAQVGGKFFYRLVHIEEISSNSNSAKVTIKWTDRGGQYRYLTAEEILYNWR